MDDLPQNSDLSSRAWYAASIIEFLQADFDSVLGRLARNSDFTVLPAQRDAWLAQICLLQDHLGGLTGSLFMEFSIPRMGRRIDTVLLIGPLCLRSSSRWATLFSIVLLSIRCGTTLWT